MPLTLPESCFDHHACLLACARGERPALRDLYEQESARLLGIARRIARDDTLAQDIVHDAFIRIWNGAGSFDPARGSARGLRNLADQGVEQRLGQCIESLTTARREQ